MLLRRNYFLILLSVFLIASCRSEKKEIHLELTTDSVLIYHDSDNLATVNYNQTIMQLPEYQNWEYNYNNPNRKGNSHFESRKVQVNTKSFYHIELLRQQMGKLEESTTCPEVLVCYFRVDATTTTIQILNEQKKIFFDLMSPQGRAYFNACLKNKTKN